MDKVSPNIIANYVLWKLHDTGDVPTNLKMQKLVYFIQAWHLGLYGEPLFDEDFQAWVHGPVLPLLYQRFKGNGWDRISEHVEEKPEIDADVEQHLNDVLSVYAEETAWKLERMTHCEDPWLIARNGLPRDESSENIITKESMIEFYAHLAEED